MAKQFKELMNEVFKETLTESEKIGHEHVHMYLAKLKRIEPSVDENDDHSVLASYHADHSLHHSAVAAVLKTSTQNRSKAIKAHEAASAAHLKAAHSHFDADNEDDGWGGSEIAREADEHSKEAHAATKKAHAATNA